MVDVAECGDDPVGESGVEVVVLDVVMTHLVEVE